MGGKVRPNTTVCFDPEGHMRLMYRLMPRVKHWMTLVCFASLLWIVPQSASAQRRGQNAPAPAPAAQPSGGGEGSSAGGRSESTTYDFDDDLVTGDYVRPDGEMLQARSRNGRKSLIRIREHFVPEMLKSVEDL